MQEQIAEVLNFVKGTLKYRWVILTITWVVCIGGWLFVSALPNSYTSEARVQVDNSAPDFIYSGKKLDLVALLRRIQQLMYNKTSLEQIIHLADLDAGIKTDLEHQKLMEKLTKNIKFKGGTDQLFNISFEANNPVSAQKGLQAVLTVFSEYTKKGILSDSVKDLKFIEEQIKDYEEQLQKAEKAKEEYNRAMFQGAGKDGDSVAELQTVNKQLRDAKIQFSVAVSREKSLQEALDRTMSHGVIEVPALDETLSPEDDELKSKKAHLAELSDIYTDDHPTIVRLKNRIAALEKKKKRDKTEPAGEQNESVFNNPYIQQQKLTLNEANTQVAAAQAMIDELSKLKTNIEKGLDDGLRADTEKKNLYRNYETIKAYHAEKLKEREDLILSIKSGERGVVEFKINDAPNVPLQPSSPNRKLLFSAVFAVGIILGFATAFLLYFVRPTIMSTSQIRQLIGLPILGSVSLKSSPDLIAKNKMETLKYGYASFGLVCIYVGLMTVDLLEIKVLSLSHWL